MKNSLLAASLAVAVFTPSCTTVDTEGALNTVGRMVPVEKKHAWIEQKKHNEKAYTVHTYGNTAYIEIPVRYIPARAKWFHCLQVGGCPVALRPYVHRRGPEYKHPKDGIYYAVVAKEQLHSPAMPALVQKLIPATEPLPKGTTTGTITLPHGAQNIVSSHLKDELSWTNAAIQPVRWVATVADVPLSFIATPVNWILQPLGVNLWYY